MQLSFGSDPEFFLYDRKLRECVPALGVTTGTKAKPEHLWDGFSLQLDGVALELNTPVMDDPLHLMWSTRAFVRSNKFQRFINHRLKQNEVRFVPSSRITYRFPEEMWKDVPDENKALGCDPDYNAHTGEMNVLPPPEIVGSFRTASGHLSVGFVEEGENLLDYGQEGFNAARAIALRLALRFIRASHFFRAEEIKRRQLYGASGAFRPKPFGVEWREPSCSWMVKDTSIMHNTYKQMKLAIPQLREKS